MDDIERIISFGGWDFSAKPETFNILREAVKPENRGTFSKNIIAFLDEHGLDGVNLDWEYPGVSAKPLRASTQRHAKLSPSETN